MKSFAKKIVNLGLWWRTIRDLPPQQITARIQFEIKRRSLSQLSLPLRRYLTFRKISTVPPLNLNYLKQLELTPLKSVNAKSLCKNPSPEVTFTFLNETRTLALPIPWNSQNYSRLWQFNLHYFDWIRDRITRAYQEKELQSASCLEIYSVITDWIDHNPFYSFDGWHPYTTSLRIVNWTYAIHTFPQLKTAKILKSLWEQIYYLNHNKEYFAGGNHLLENLRALIIGGLNFNHPKAEKIVQTSLQELAQQLSYQILPDGGHYERSPMYHLIVMNLLGESIACLLSANLSIPPSILDALSKMLVFAQGIRLQNGNYPLWNDAAYQITYSLDETVYWIQQLLPSSKTQQSQLSSPINILHFRLLSKDIPQIRNPHNNVNNSKNSSSYHAPHTGYSILRNGLGIELGFDYGLPCPPELPPHAHADCLTLDLYYQGQPIIVDTGTSEYQKGLVREYERSTKAHNTIEIDQQNQSEVWGSFRVGRKAKPFNVKSGNFEGLQWLSAAHHGYNRSPIQSIHHRWIGLENTNVILLDIIETHQHQSEGDRQDLHSTARLHFAPNINLIQDSSGEAHYHTSEHFNLWIKTFNSPEPNHVQWLNPEISSSWYSPQFSQRIPRGCLEVKSRLNHTYHALLTVISLQAIPAINWRSNSPADFQLNLNQINLTWKMSQSELVFQHPN
ncbi:alginate lyase family protein [Spirulina sp. CCNP1310]|uniref:alginate lyase family protein n=1 Tax=Spirulina sp. CCNP1310 TaxID=3110249 RepID=UPI002B1EA3D3|nr:alginate lyase family protein [Spirulina sp. CCNP1310]MEA5421454.1 alginate lyase family protein [Spirulina sp. CCNP1310]